MKKFEKGWNSFTLTLVKKVIVLVVLLGLFQSEVITANHTVASEAKPLSGKYISVIGDSISTYTGWSDSRPITSEECTYRYGEAYYGPVGGDFHNTELLVDDTWWYQAAQELGAEILVSNAGNSTGLLYASYPNNLEWQQYLQEMLAYKSRPYYLGTEEHDPDIIAIYIGSADVGKGIVAQFGSVEDVDFDTLIVKNPDGTYTYGEPVTVAEAYCIMLHKIVTTYPNAEVYCFTVVPNSGGNVSTGNKRLAAVYPFNEMIKGVAEYYDAIVVENFEAFKPDSDGDGVATQEDWDTFKTYFNGDPHPNALGFDVITDCFVKTVLENSEYNVQMETTTGKKENISVDLTKNMDEYGTTILRIAKDYITPSGMIVDYSSTSKTSANRASVFSEIYKFTNKDGTYLAEGGSEKRSQNLAPILTVDIPLNTEDDDSTEKDETMNIAFGRETGILEEKGDIKTKDEDGIYDYTITEVTEQGMLSIDTQAVTVTQTIGTGCNDEMTYVYNKTGANEDNDLIVRGVTEVQIPKKADEVPAISDGYEYVYIGSDKFSTFWAAHASYKPDLNACPDEKPIYSDENGAGLYVWADHTIFINRNLVVPRLYFADKMVEGTFPARYDSIQQFTLSDANGQVLTAYCADQVTNAEKGYSYHIENVSDASYYSNSAAQMIHTVALDGYWGTSSDFGSLDAVKQMMQQSGRFSDEEIKGMTDGIAMTATQYAIWTFSNEMEEKEFVNAYYTNKASAPSKVADEFSAALIMKLYHYLISLEPTVIGEEDKTTQNTIINEKNFLDGISLKITGKPQEHSNNLDRDDSNDAYHADISFAFKVQPRTGNGDSLVLEIVDSQGNVMAVGRISGEQKEGEVLITPDESGRYTFSNICLQEGVESINFVLSGWQNLGKQAYLLTSEVLEEESSQTMVCIAEGPRSVNVAMNIQFELCVEDERVSTERVWRMEKTMPTPTPVPTETPTSEPTEAPTPEATPTVEPSPTIEPTPTIQSTPAPTVEPTDAPMTGSGPMEEETPTSTEEATPTPQANETPRTGDNLHFGRYIVLMLLCSMLLLVVGGYVVRHYGKEEVKK